MQMGRAVAKANIAFLFLHRIVCRCRRERILPDQANYTRKRRNVINPGKNF